LYIYHGKDRFFSYDMDMMELLDHHMPNWSPLTLGAGVAALVFRRFRNKSL
jgi:hypothetical protein